MGLTYTPHCNAAGPARPRPAPAHNPAGGAASTRSPPSTGPCGVGLVRMARAQTWLELPVVRCLREPETVYCHGSYHMKLGTSPTCQLE